MEMLAMVHMPREVKAPSTDYLCVQEAPTPFITPEASEVSQYLETERFYCPEHGPYMADGEMGGCLGCTDIKLNISMSRDTSLNDFTNDDLLDMVLDGAATDSQEFGGLMPGIITRSRFDATKELFDYMMAYESCLETVKESGVQSTFNHSIGLINRRRSCNLPKSRSGNLPGKLVRVTSKDDFAISYKEDEMSLVFGENFWERSKSVPEKLNLFVDMDGRRRHLWATSLRDVSTAT